MAGIETNCSDCCFYNNIQKKCQHNILHVFENNGSNIRWENSGPIIDRICQYKRSNEWLIWNEIKNDDEKIQLCRNEVYLKGTIILLADDLNSFISTVEKLKTIEHFKNFKIIVIYKNIKYNKILTYCANNINNEYKLINIVNDDIKYQIYKSLTFAKNGYLFIIDSSKELDEKLIDKINYIINIKMLRLLHVIGSDGLHQSVSMIHLYKFLKGDLQCNFADKLKDISEEEKSDAQIFTWKDIDEQYSC